MDTHRCKPGAVSRQPSCPIRATSRQKKVDSDRVNIDEMVSLIKWEHVFPLHNWFVVSRRAQHVSLHRSPAALSPLIQWNLQMHRVQPLWCASCIVLYVFTWLAVISPFWTPVALKMHRRTLEIRRTLLLFYFRVARTTTDGVRLSPYIPTLNKIHLLVVRVRQSFAQISLISNTNDAFCCVHSHNLWISIV